MDFSNAQLSVDDIPRVEDVKLTPIAKSFLYVIAINKFIWISLVIGLLTIAKYSIQKEGFQHYFWYIFTLVVIVLMLNTLMALMAFKKRKYAIREQDVIYAHGLWVHSLVTVPISRIQHIEESRSWLARQFDLAALNLYTAGESGSDLSIKGLPYADAKQLKEFISERINATS